jgi:hypothetical protein
LGAVVINDVVGIVVDVVGILVDVNIFVVDCDDVTPFVVVDVDNVVIGVARLVTLHFFHSGKMRCQTTKQ